MKTSLIITHDTRRPKKDGTFPLVFRLSHFRNTISIPTGISIFTSDWDNKKRCVKKSYKGVSSVTRLNNQLQKKKALIFDIITQLDEEGTLGGYSITQLKQRIIGVHSHSDFFVFTNGLIENLTQAGRFGNARLYKQIVGIVQSFSQISHPPKKLLKLD